MGRLLVIGAFLLAVAAAAAAPPPGPVAAIGGLPKLPPGPVGQIAVVAQGPYSVYSTGKVLPVVIRNNTKRPVSGVHIAALAVDPKGRDLAPGEDDGIQPAVVPPGGVALGFLRFGGTNLPASTRYRFTVTDTPAGANVGFSAERDLVVSGRYTGGHVAGTGTNTTRKRLTKPFVVLAACFDRAGRMLTFGKGFGAKAPAAPRKIVPFDIDFTRRGKLPAPACKHVLVSMIGYGAL